jgi:hypothetical protein
MVDATKGRKEKQKADQEHAFDQKQAFDQVQAFEETSDVPQINTIDICTPV